MVAKRRQDFLKTRIFHIILLKVTNFQRMRGISQQIHTLDRRLNSKLEKVILRKLYFAQNKLHGLSHKNPDWAHCFFTYLHPLVRDVRMGNERKKSFSRLSERTVFTDKGDGSKSRIVQWISSRGINLDFLH